MGAHNEVATGFEAEVEEERSLQAKRFQLLNLNQLKQKSQYLKHHDNALILGPYFMHRLTSSATHLFLLPPESTMTAIITIGIVSNVPQLPKHDLNLGNEHDEVIATGEGGLQVEFNCWSVLPSEFT